MQAQVARFSKQPDTASTDEDVKAFAEELGADPSVIERLVNLARKGLSPQVPKEVSDLLKEREMEKAVATEEKAFENRFARLAKALPEIAAHKERIKELAYSDEKAPDGEPYAEKELSEIYLQFIKPEVEPGKVSGEQGRAPGGTRSGVIDFEAIQERDDPKDIQSMDDETFKKYMTWLEEKGNKTGAIVQRF